MRPIRNKLPSIVVGMTTVMSVIGGCTASADGLQPSQVESRLDSNGTAEDHVAAAFLYEQKAERALDEAARYEQEASAINPLDVPKDSGATHSSRQQKSVGRNPLTYGGCLFRIRRRTDYDRQTTASIRIR